MRIVLGADHGGYELKETIKRFLTEKGYEINDVGCHSLHSVDYPDIADDVVAEIAAHENHKGILVCGTGIGMSISANRNMAIRAAVCHDEFTTRMSREHNDANILCLGARVLNESTALDLVNVWLEAEFTGGRHQRRISKYSE